MNTIPPVAIPSVAPPSEANRREQLRLLCALDRARIRLIIHPPEAPQSLGSELMEKAREALPWLLPLAPAVLGSVGKKLIGRALK